MSSHMIPSSQMDKLLGTIRIAIILILLSAAAYFFGPSLVQGWNKSSLLSKASDTSESALRAKAGDDALANVQLNGTQILNQAYPLAFGNLDFTNAELVGVGALSDGYNATVRLHYRNLFNRSHYLEIAFSFDSHAGYRSSRFVKHTDIIAPKELTLGTLMKLASE